MQRKETLGTWRLQKRVMIGKGKKERERAMKEDGERYYICVNTRVFIFI